MDIGIYRHRHRHQLWDFSAPPKMTPSKKRRLSSSSVSCGHDENQNDTSSKICHNANERERRKKVNALYAKLASLVLTLQTKKLNNPTIVAKALEYIPALEEELKALKVKRDTLMRSSTRESSPPSASLGVDVQVLNVGPDILLTVHSSLKSPPLLSDLIFLIERENASLLSASISVSQTLSLHTFYLHFEKPAKICNFRNSILSHLVEKIQDLKSNQDDSVDGDDKCSPMIRDSSLQDRRDATE